MYALENAIYSRASDSRTYTSVAIYPPHIGRTRNTGQFREIDSDNLNGELPCSNTISNSDRTLEHGCGGFPSSGSIPEWQPYQDQMQSTAGEADLEHDAPTLHDSSNVQATNILITFGADANDIRSPSSLF